MKLKNIYTLAAALCGLLPNLSAQAQGTAFTYQGQLSTTNGPANGNYDFTFTLFNNFTNGTPLGGPLIVTNVAVTNGLFTLALDFGSVFTGEPAWLGLGVRTNGSGSYLPLTPLQELTPAPYAVYAASANATNLVGTVQSANLSGVALLAGGNEFTGNQSITSGSMGIGTTSPMAPVEVRTTSPSRNLVMSGPGAGIWSFFDTTGGKYLWDISGGTNSFQISRSGLDYPLTISLETGNIGIGTTTPSQALEVNGNALVDDQLIVSNQITSAGTAAALTFQCRTNSEVNWQWRADTTRADFGSFGGGGPTDALSILQSGNIGIGTTTPATALQVNGTVTASGFSGNGSGLTGLVATNVSGVALVSESNTFSGNQIFNNGNIGIGTNAHLAQFEVLANNYGAQPVGIFTVENCGAACAQQDFQENIRLINQDGNGQTGIGFLTAGTWDLSTVPNAWIGTDYGSSANNLSFCTQNGGVLTNRMHIDGTTGNVGIGTTAPAGPLEIVTANGTLTVQNGPYTVEMVATSPGSGGHMRFRNGFEVWPDNAAANAGYLDVRDTTATPTIILDGSSGNVTCVAVNITSDRNAKEDFKNLSPRDVLAKVASLPITEWQYKAEKTKDAAAVRHIGPMAQDFSAAFELGHDEKHISVVDESGVALAAIQGLNEELKETRAENAELKHTVAELKSMMEQIQRNLAASQNK